MMAFVEDLAPFFVDWAIDAVIGGVTVPGIFDKTYLESMGIVAGSNPVLLVPASVSAAEGTAVSVNGTSYTVASVEPDGTGLTILQLEAV